VAVYRFEKELPEYLKKYFPSQDQIIRSVESIEL
jgi:hypothetical protein